MLTLLIVMTGLMAGIYFTFSVFIMKSLSELPTLQGAQAMNKINDVILNTLFLPLFFASTMICAGMIIWSFADWKAGQSLLIVSAAAIYILGMFFVTAFGNVPLNNKLKNSKDEVELEFNWQEYLHRWTRLNHLRTLSCIASSILLINALPQG